MALRRLTGHGSVVGIGPDRLPIWPEGIVGSISHSRQDAVALVASAWRYHAVGVDVETVMDAASARNVLAVMGPVEATDPLSLTLAFSAKESLFKALSSKVGYFGFEAARLDGEGGLVLTQDLSPDWRVGFRIKVNCRIGKGRVLTWIALPT